MALQIKERQKYEGNETEFIVLPNIVDLLIEDSKIVGICTHNRYKNNCLIIWIIEIFPNLRGNSLGTEFVKKYEEIARQRECNRIEAHVSSAETCLNERKRNFWEKKCEFNKGDLVDGIWIYYKNL